MAWGGRCRRGSDRRKRSGSDRQRCGSTEAWIGAWVGDVEAGEGDVDDELQTGVEEATLTMSFRPELRDGDESE